MVGRTVRSGPNQNCSASAAVGPPGPPTPPNPNPPPRPPPPGPPPGTLTLSDMFLGVGGAVAVVQRDATVSVWGTGTPGTTVEVVLGLGRRALGATVTASSTVNSTGGWMVWLPPQPAEYNRTLTATVGTDKAVTTVSFGETILCVGQSNSALPPPVHSFVVLLALRTFKCRPFRRPLLGQLSHSP